MGRFGSFWGRFGVPARHHGSGSAGRCCAGGGWVPFSPGAAAARPASGAASLKITLITRQPRGGGGPAVLQNVPVLLGSGRVWSSAVCRTPPQRGESCPEPPMPCMCRACGSGSFSLSSPPLTLLLVFFKLRLLRSPSQALRGFQDLRALEILGRRMPWRCRALLCCCWSSLPATEPGCTSCSARQLLLHIPACS